MAMGRFGISCVIVFFLFFGAAVAASSDRKNILGFSEGALVLFASSQFDADWDPLYLIDDNDRTGWCSAEGKPKKNEIVIELARNFKIEEIILDSKGSEEKDFPGCSVRSFEVWASKTSSQKGFSKVLAGKAAKSNRNIYKIPKPLECRWVKLVVKDNWGHEDYTQLMEIKAFGKPADKKNPKTGTETEAVFETNFGPLKIKQHLSQAMGCYGDHANPGRVNGETDGRRLRLQWEESDTQSGGAILNISTDRGAIGGFRFLEGKPAGVWQGKAATTLQPKCRTPLDRKDSLRETLDKTGYAILFGVRFLDGTANLTKESEEILKDLLEVISKRQEAGFIVEGHFDDAGAGDDAQNMSLHRAQTVMGWLLSHGMEPERLSAEGYGRTRPVADNGTAEGRILNQRVEMHMTK